MCRTYILGGSAMAGHANPDKIVSSLPDPLFVAQGRHLIYLNPALQRMVGDLPKDPQRIPIHRLFPGKGGRRLLSSMEKALESGSSIKVEAELSAKSTLLPVEVLLFPLDGGGNGSSRLSLVAGRLRDISSEKMVIEHLNSLKLEKCRLRADLDRLRALIDKSGDGFAVVNHQRIVEYQNAQMTAWFGDRVGKRCPYMPPSSSPCALCHQVFTTGEKASLEITGPNGRTFNLHCSPFTDTDGSAKALLVARDVTEYKRMAESLQKSEMVYRNLATMSLHGIFVIDGDRVTFANQIFATLVNRTLEEIYQLPLQEVFSNLESSSRAALLSHLRRQRSRKSLRGLYHIRSLEGKQRWLDVVTFPIIYHGRSAVQGVIVDITSRKEAEVTLQASEEKYRILAESSPNGILILSHGRVVYANPAAARLAGVTPKELQGWTVDALITLAHPEDQPRLKSCFKARVKELRVPSRHEFRIIDKQGNIKWVELHSRRIKLADASAVQYILVDITEQKRVLAALKESEQKYRILAEQSPLAIVIATKKGIIYANRRFSKITGFSVQEVQKWSPEEIRGYVHPEDAKRVEDAIEAGLEGKRIPKRIEFRIISKDGDIVWLEAYARTITYRGDRAIQVILQDVTDRKRAEQTLKESEARYRTLVEGLEEAVLLLDSEPRVVFSNPRAQQMLGYTAEELKGKTYQELVSPDLHPKIKKELEKRRRGMASRYEIEVLDSKGRRIPVLVAASPILTNGEMTGILTAFTDITALKDLERQLRREKQEAELYTDVVTHDLNNVNQALMTYLELLAMDQDVTPGQDKLLREARALVRRSAKLCSKVRRLFQIRAAARSLHQVDLASVLRHIAETTPQQHPHRQVTINLKLPKGKIPAWADELVDELFFNLVDNAVHYTPTEKVLIDLHVLSKPVTRDGRTYWHIRVVDRGRGIPDDRKEELLKAFVPGEARIKGSGLGLIIVRTLVDRYEGRVWFSGRVQGDHTKGTVANVLLPCAKE